MATGRTTRAKKVNYAKLNAVGTTGLDNSSLNLSFEEGELADSPLALQPSEDYLFQAEGQSTSSLMDSWFADDVDDTEVLDVVDDVGEEEVISLNSRESKVQSVVVMAGETECHDKQQTSTIPDLGSDEVRQQQECIMAANREKREQLRKKLERQRRVAEEKLQEEQGKIELVKMESEIIKINQRRSASHNTFKGGTEWDKSRQKTGRNLNPKYNVGQVVVGLVKIKQKKARMHASVDNKTTETQHAAGNSHVSDKVEQWLCNSVQSGCDEHEQWVNPFEIGGQHAFNDTMVKHDNLICCRKAMKEQRKACEGQDPDQPSHRQSMQPITRTVINRTEVAEQMKKKRNNRQNPRDECPPLIQAVQESDGESIASGFTLNSNKTCGTSSSHFKSINKDIKSGFLDKPKLMVVLKLKWPHMNQNPRYVTEPLTFNQLSFQQFVGGECRMILKTRNVDEVYGRLRVLSKVAYLFEQCRSWEKARSTYFAILSSIEEGEATWNSSFGHYDLMCPAQIETKSEQNKAEQKPNTLNKSRNMVRRDYFCKEFQKGECTLQGVHKAWIRNNLESVEHLFSMLQGKAWKIKSHAGGRTMFTT